MPLRWSRGLRYSVGAGVDQADAVAGSGDAGSDIGQQASGAECSFRTAESAAFTAGCERVLVTVTALRAWTWNARIVLAGDVTVLGFELLRADLDRRREKMASRGRRLLCRWGATGVAADRVRLLFAYMVAEESDLVCDDSFVLGSVVDVEMVDAGIEA